MEEILKHASVPIFVLNERGEVVFINPAFELAFRYGSLSTAEKGLLVEHFLSPPADLPAGSVRQATRPWGDGAKRAWYGLTFLSLQTQEGDPLVVVGHIARAPADSAVPLAKDAMAQEELARLIERQRAAVGDVAIVARSAGMRRVLDQLLLAAHSELPVTIVGEDGVGKTEIARAIRLRSRRAALPSVVIDCLALPPDVQREQLLDVAHITFESIERPNQETSFPILGDPEGGTLVFTHASRLAMDLQDRLVALAEEANPPRWRWILTEREDPQRLVSEGRWSVPFFHWATRQRIDVPPLRERREDIEMIAMQLFALPASTNEKGDRVAGLEPAALTWLQAYDYPGNVEELITILRRAIRKSHKPFLTERDLPRFLIDGDRHDVPAESALPLPSLDEVLASVERRLIGLALERHRGNKSKASKELGISRPRLHRRAVELGLALGNLEENQHESTDSTGEDGKE